MPPAAPRSAPNGRADPTPGLDELERALVAEIDQALPSAGLFAARLDPRHPATALLRAAEQGWFPAAPSSTAPATELFLAIVDTRPGARRLVHGFRLGLASTERPDRHGTGLAFLDDLVASGQGLTTDVVRRFYLGQGVDIERAVSVEANVRVGEPVGSPVPGLRTSDFGYLSLFHLLRERGTSLVLAHLNARALASLEELGLEHEPVVGRADLRAPGFDDRHPTAVPMSAHNVGVFTGLRRFAVPELVFGPEELEDVVIHLPS